MSRIKQFGLTVALMTTVCFVGSAAAVPVKPDLEKILNQQEHRRRTFEPAQAGWNGPEMQRPQDVAPNAVLEAYGPAATARSVRAGLIAAAVPDPKAVVAIAVLIILMRVMRQVQERRKQVGAVMPIRAVGDPGEERRAA